MLNQDELFSLVYLTYKEHEKQILETEDLVQRLRLRRTSFEEIEAAALQLGVGNTEVLPPADKRKAHLSRRHKARDKRAGRLSDELLKVERRKWEGKSYLDMAFFICDMRTKDAAPPLKPEPPVVQTPIVLPTTGNSYFPEAAAEVAAAARKDGALAVLNKWVQRIIAKHPTPSYTGKAAAAASAVNTPADTTQATGTTGQKFIKVVVAKMARKKAARIPPLPGFAEVTPRQAAGRDGDDGGGKRVKLA